MAYLSNGVCFPTIVEAQDNYYSSFTPSVSYNGDTKTVNFLTAQNVSGVWKYQVLNGTGALISSSNAPTAIYGSCTVPNDPSTNFLNGMELGWAVAGVMIIVFCIRRSYRGF